MIASTLPRTKKVSIIDSQIRELVHRIDETEEYSGELDSCIQDLVRVIRATCSLPEVASKYARNGRSLGTLEKYPLDCDGYILAFDPLYQEQEFFDCWEHYGIVASNGAISNHLCDSTTSRVHQSIRLLSNGRLDLSISDSHISIPADDTGIPIVSDRFLEIYNDGILTAVRQSVRVYLHYVLIWGRPDLRITCDRIAVTLPQCHESKAPLLHLDQNPLVHPEFRTVLGSLSLTDDSVGSGTFVGVPGSKRHFREYASMTPGQGEYVELDMNSSTARALTNHQQLFSRRARDLISWDGRTTHAISKNTSDGIGMEAFLTSSLADREDGNVSANRAYRTGEADSIRSTCMHAGKLSRFSNQEVLAEMSVPEKLSRLERLLYGQQS